MTISAVLALRRAIRKSLIKDQILLTALNGPNIFDESPPHHNRPYITFSSQSSRDWSSASYPGDEQYFILTIWSSEHGVTEGLEISERVIFLINDAKLDLDGHRLISLSYVDQIAKRENAGRFARVDVRFRATTEKQ